ncbi:exonuclease V isoform X1 [Rhinatrema bivittatum]|uniref:exonuclease V isoform X1 n=1 Tax=Rhinatrema bivittatum TaxID=194408 RepID=UPI00112E092A|nr:exonuclease V isoform X1 [Rhinatrema bivittatum]
MASAELQREEKSEEDNVEERGDGFSDISDSEFLHLDDLMMESAQSQGEAESNKRSYETHQSQGELQDTSETANTENSSPSTELSEGSKPSVEQGKDTAGKNQRKRKPDARNPLERYHLKYLCVTDLCSQAWCEQQMVYGMDMPEIMEIQDILQPERAALMDTGASIHLARELEVHDIVSVSTKTREDSWAIKFLNLLSMVSVLQAGGPVREFPVFGEIEGIFLVGVIDELHYTPKGELELNELKTRGHPSLPGRAQKRKYHLQVQVYKLIFDAMVRGQMNLGNLIGHLGLNPEQPLGTQVREHVQSAGLTVNCFGDLLELTCLNLTFSDLPNIDRLRLEYHYQGDSSLIGAEMVRFEGSDVKEQLGGYIAYWKGQREPKGVDIEEAWKCQSCGYAEICEWREKRGTVISHAKKAKQ